jgi:S1-C subfamily serine protease
VLEGSVTVGVVSAKARNEISIGGSTPSYQDFIQTDAAINFGNSGGPLVDAHGRAVGINTAFSGPGRGLGFAVSINLAREVAKSLIEDGRVKRGFLGVVLQRLDPMLAEGLGLPDAHGVLVRDVQGETPAERAGILPGDAIVRFDGVAVRDLPSFRLRVARTPNGRQVPVEVYRRGSLLQVQVELSERPDLEGRAGATPPADPSGDLGLDLSDSLETIDSGATGVRVIGVAAGSVASMAGILAEDLIVEVGGTPIGEAAGCLRLLQEERRKGHPAVVTVRRGGDRWYVAIPAEP